jgi:quinoprotein glucose dehydrogenase
MDIPCAPILADITVNGRAVKAIAQPTKQAFLYVLDRVTGRPIWPIEERPVATGDVPGEWYSPTQPFPLDGRGNVFAYDRQGFLESDLIDFTPELHDEGARLIAKYKIGPVFTPPVVSTAEGPLGTIAMGTSAGGTVWGGGSYDPESHVLYIYSRRFPVALGLVKPDPTKNDLDFIQGNALTGPRTDGGEGGGGLAIQGLPIVKPPYGSISAISLDKGEILWQIAHGDTPDYVRNHPALKGLTIPRTGQAGILGMLVTKTLLIAGDAQVTTADHPRGAMLRAYDKATGQDVGALLMPAQQTGSPMTYLLNGKQYLIVAIGGGNYAGELITFKLPS